MTDQNPWKQAVLRKYPRAAGARGRLLARLPERSLARQVHELKARVADLEEEVQEARRLHLRVAELTDVVGEVLLPLEQRDDERIRQVLQGYSATL